MGLCDWLCGCLTTCTGSTLPVEIESDITGELRMRLIPKDSTAIEVTWAGPYQAFNYYKIRYRRAVGPGRWKSVKPRQGSNHFLITQLKPDTEYEFQIENKSLPVEEQVYSESMFARTSRGTATDRQRVKDAERTRLLQA